MNGNGVVAASSNSVSTAATAPTGNSNTTNSSTPDNMTTGKSHRHGTTGNINMASLTSRIGAVRATSSGYDAARLELEAWDQVDPQARRAVYRRHHPNLLRRAVSEVVAQRHDDRVGVQQR